MALDQLPQGGERMMTSKNTAPDLGQNLFLGSLVQKIVPGATDEDVDAPEQESEAVLLAHVGQILGDGGFASDAGKQVQTAQGDLPFRSGIISVGANRSKLGNWPPAACTLLSVCQTPSTNAVLIGSPSPPGMPGTFKGRVGGAAVEIERGPIQTRHSSPWELPSLRPPVSGRPLRRLPGLVEGRR